MDGRMPAQSYREGLARKYQSVANDIEERKKGKSSATMEQKVGDNLIGCNSPHHQIPFDNVSNYGYHDMMVQNSHPLHKGGYQERSQVRGGRREGLGGRGYHRPQEEYPRHEALNDDNFYEDYGENPNAKELKSHKDQIEQEKFQGLNFDVQDFMELKF
ncbi:hypothetical protein M9H77_29749 [Catharanthus roseus]|uniref:Uncharacterized protein n=1 Tax=Catharanthus roseus TaxID=4058 RepID=A0ACB9ZXW4_CATRO|nr:hypothetical protein M9H77_29749 [Catharanthus roseus]